MRRHLDVSCLPSVFLILTYKMQLKEKYEQRNWKERFQDQEETKKQLNHPCDVQI